MSSSGDMGVCIGHQWKWKHGCVFRVCWPKMETWVCVQWLPSSSGDIGMCRVFVGLAAVDVKYVRSGKLLEIQVPQSHPAPSPSPLSAPAGLCGKLFQSEISGAYSNFYPTFSISKREKIGPPSPYRCFLYACTFPCLKPKPPRCPLFKREIAPSSSLKGEQHDGVYCKHRQAMWNSLLHNDARNDTETKGKNRQASG